MEFVEPAKQGSRPVVLAGLYPFLHDTGAYDRDAALASLKAECIIQPECTIPGSMVLEEPTLRKLVTDNIELVKAGALVLDLRKTVKSFTELVEEKYGKSGLPEMRKMAEFLDEICPRVLHFDPTQSSDDYKKYLITFLSELAETVETGLEKKSIFQLVEKLERQGHHLTYQEAMNLRTNIAKVDRRIEAAAKFFYCACGGETLNAIVQVPQELFQVVHADRSVAQISPAEITGATDLSVAHHAILDHFAVQLGAMRRLTSDDVLELRSDGATRQAVDQVKGIIAEVNVDLEQDRNISAASLAALAEYQRKIGERVRAQCLKQAKRKGYSELVGVGVEQAIEVGTELLGHAVPGLGLLRRGGLYLGRVISRKSSKMKRADLTTTPIETYARRVQTRISIRSSERG
jgi:hypothetical protein